MIGDIPNSKHVSISDVAHMVSMEKTEEFNKAVLEFLKPL
jgi:pimeloyl-ACP methyl ester carboxylesterase